MGKKRRYIEPETVARVVDVFGWHTYWEKKERAAMYLLAVVRHLYPHYERCSPAGRTRIAAAVQSALTRACNKGLLKHTKYDQYRVP